MPITSFYGAEFFAGEFFFPEGVVIPPAPDVGYSGGWGRIRKPKTKKELKDERKAYGISFDEPEQTVESVPVVVVQPSISKSQLLAVQRRFEQENTVTTDPLALAIAVQKTKRRRRQLNDDDLLLLF